MRRRPRSRQAIRLAALLALAGCNSDSPEPQLDGPRHVLLISLDTLRADACSLYGYEKPTTPFLEELGRRGVVFEKHMVNSNNTLTSHATMLTGLTMIAHGADNNTNAPLAPQHVTVTERFQEAGFATVGIASHEIWLSELFGMAQGFDTFESFWKYDAPTINRRFVEWVESEKPRRIFGFLHYYDAHSELEGELPYSAPPEYLERFAGEPPEGFDPTLPNPSGKGRLTLATYLNQFQSRERSLPPGYAAYLRGCYEAGVAKLDADLRDLFAELDRLGILDEALIVITSDHGEEFEDHGGVLHNGWDDEIMHVPLLIVPPAGTPLPQPRVSDTTRAVDLAATMLDLAGLPPLDPTQGRSLRPLMEGDTLDYQKTFFGRMVLRDRDAHSEFKFVWDSKAPLFFYDLDADPGETENLVRALAESDPARLEAASEVVVAARREGDLVMHLIAAETGQKRLNPRQLAELERLGYLGGAEEGEDEPAAEDGNR